MRASGLFLSAKWTTRCTCRKYEVRIPTRARRRELYGAWFGNHPRGFTFLGAGAGVLGFWGVVIMMHCIPVMMCCAEYIMWNEVKGAVERERLHFGLKMRD